MVASRLLPAGSRRHLISFYGYARLVDQIGDAYAGDRPAALDWLEEETRRGLDGSAAVHSLVAAATSSVLELGADPRPLFDLIEANRMDQTVASYERFEDLERYCRLSANPVGRLVLAAFGPVDAERTRLSDRICTGLQLVEHWQDVQEDARAGRIYIPQEDLRRFGVEPAELAGAGPAPARLRALMAFEVARAREWLESGRPLLDLARGRFRLAVAGFWAGGQAALDGLSAADFDVLSPPSRPRARRVAAHLVPALLFDRWRRG